jgi:hypothetical protein
MGEPDAIQDGVTTSAPSAEGERQNHIIRGRNAKERRGHKQSKRGGKHADEGHSDN